LEYSVNVALDDIPRWLSIVTLEVPDRYHDQKLAQLPANWDESPAPSSIRALGTKWLNDCKHLLLRVPSSVIPQEFNILINPLHPELREVKILSVEDFVYDVRIKAGK
jgi:RES domain-containing protein